MLHNRSKCQITDFIDLSLLLKPGSWGARSQEGIFACYPTKDHVSIYSELPSSNRILKSGYMIDSLLTQYQKINFADRRNWFCNSNKNQYKDKTFEVT
ncbi:unnamed protein product [Rotaria magnacalcarata]|uniref:Uncharacterized protein n=1 Tax=Rotaria magnacalcarata TaxID=392030 RepID=A0A8S2W7K1_9BILA|nr:unnamed protein product [Rotaria magnacalcarata]CAF4437171.1 unnamed protein product [Rotaria magnacalcarata]CAF5109868.1 unnamed protein product [Rotaria magnacalcarata]